MSNIMKSVCCHSGTRLPPLWAMPLRPAFMKERLGLLAKVDKFYFAENAAQNS